MYCIRLLACFCIILPLATFKLFAADALVDDCEGGTNINKFGFSWYMYDDSKDGGNSTIPGVTKTGSNYAVVPTATAAHAGNFGIALPYSLGPIKAGSGTGYNYIGMGTKLCANSKFLDLTGASAVTFWLKCDRAISVEFHLIDSVNIKDNGYYHALCVISAVNTWQQFTINMTTGTGGVWQSIWAHAATFSLKTIASLQWQIHSDNVGTNTTGTVNIDDIYIANYSYPPPSVPVLESPENNALNIARNPTLRWLITPNAVSYRFQISTLSDFSTTVKDSSGVMDTSITLSGLSSSTKYYWSVNATNGVGTSSWSTTSTFTTVPAPPTPPVTVAPAAGTVNVSIPTSLLWNRSATATSYHLQISTLADFSHIIKDTTGLLDTSITLPNLSNSQKYYWWVSAINAGGASGWSTSTNFTTMVGATSIVSPITGSINLPIAVTAVWHSVLTAVSYRLQLSTASNFNTTLKDTAGVTDTSLVLSGLKNNTQYFLRVNVTNAGGSGNWSTVINFTTIAATPGIPIPVFPSVGAVNVTIPITFVWHSVPTSTSYRIQVSTTPDFNEIVKDSSGLTDTSFALAGLVYNKKYYWCVNAANVGGVSNWMPTDSFSTTGLPSIVTLLIPLDTAKLPTDSVMLKWNNAVPSVTTYFLQVATDSSMSHVFFQDSTLSDTTKILKALSANVTYWWRVKAKNVAGWGNYSVKMKFAYVAPEAILPSQFEIRSFSLNGSGNVLRYTLPKQCFVNLKYYDVTGRLVASFVNKTQNAGYYSLLIPISYWANGTYIQEFIAGSFIRKIKLTIMR